MFPTIALLHHDVLNVTGRAQLPNKFFLYNQGARRNYSLLGNIDNHDNFVGVLFEWEHFRVLCLEI